MTQELVDKAEEYEKAVDQVTEQKQEVDQENSDLRE